VARGRAPGYDEQRDTILARAAELFAQQGSSATSMKQIAAACGLSKATLYHYFRDKESMLARIAEAHVLRLHAVLAEVDALGGPPQARLRELIARFVHEYAGAQHAHRVLTEDVKFLGNAERERVLAIERELVSGFAGVMVELRPDLADAQLAKPMTMLLFGMINWMFTWMRPDGPLNHAALAPLVADLFLGGLPEVSLPTATARRTENLAETPT